MKLNQLIAAILCLCLCCAAMPALAAPAREIRAMDVLVTDEMKILAAIMHDAMPTNAWNSDEGQTVLAEGEAPSPAFANKALAAAVLYTQGTGTVLLTEEEAKALYSQVFTAGEYQPSEAAHAPDLFNEEGRQFVRLTEGGVEIQGPEVLLAQGTVYGIHIYSTSFDGTDVTVLYDLYTLECASFGAYAGSDQELEEEPEDVITWTYSGEMSLREAPGTLFGYTVNSLSITPKYQLSDIDSWTEVENTEYEYSVNIPSFLGLAEDDPAHRSWQTADGSASLTIDVAEESQSYDAALARFQQEHPDMTVEQARDWGYFTALGQGEFYLVYASEELNWSYTLTMCFPVERQTEYELYSEFIRNSMIVWGLSNG